MLSLKIISTIFLGISFFTAIIKNAAVCEVTDGNGFDLIRMSFCSLLWRALVIVTIWVS